MAMRWTIVSRRTIILVQPATIMMTHVFDAIAAIGGQHLPAMADTLLDICRIPMFRVWASEITASTRRRGDRDVLVGKAAAGALA